jgi:hypothetical protein
MTMKRALGWLWVLALCGFPLACGSDGGSTDGVTFSCQTTTTDGLSCVDYMGGEANSGARRACTQGGSTIVESTCPTTDVGGICTFTTSVGKSRLFYYTLTPDDVPPLMSGCTDAGGSWSTN